MPLKPFPVLAFCALLLGGAAIGFAGIMMRLSDVNPVASAFWRMALAAPMLWVWAWASARGDRAAGLRTDYSTVLLLAGFFFAADMGVWHVSLHFTSVANATLLPNMAPLCIAAWLWYRYKTRFSRGFLLGMALALAGAVLLVGPSVGLGGTRLLGDGLGLLVAGFYAAYQLAVKDGRASYSTARLMAWSTSITAVFLLPFALLMPGDFWPASAAAWLPLLGLALVCQIGGQTVITYAFAHLPSSLSSISLLIQPLTAALAAWVIFNEAIGPVQMAGGAVLLLGIYLSKRGSA
ncbi:drug/metabolite transporter (DMT)-like permease [Janthinobacterium sp. CG_23.3]|uniref:DMT family transporter n=1 Tax=unclassified Janthinobacterium TaxID=2610881 RepID=UPI00034A0B95|nr:MULTISPECIES: DMT family transporter [unclassified Janthinobacterium]MEC5159960.1 drug/metabolite transporter (DMT)-like permease [Janthinobacterium sp. CG_S6]